MPNLRIYHLQFVKFGTYGAMVGLSLYNRLCPRLAAEGGGKYGISFAILQAQACKLNKL